MTPRIGNALPSVSVDYNLGSGKRDGRTTGRNNRALRLERRHVDRDGERVNGESQARHACPWCGGRALNALGHPAGGDGRPVCLEAKRKAVMLW